MRVALVGLLQSGKSTILAAISGKEVSPPGSAAIQEAIVPVPDRRVDLLAQHYGKDKKVYATVDCLDVPGLSFMDEHGRSAARHLLNQIRTVDALALVVRAFEDPSVGAYRNRVDPHKDLAELRDELLLADLELVETRIEHLTKETRKPTRDRAGQKEELALYEKLRQTIEAEKPIASAIETEQQMETIRSLGFLTVKPVVIVVNVNEHQLNQQFDFSGVLKDYGCRVTLCARLEYELAQLDAASRREFMADLGLSEAAAGRFVRGCFEALDMICFLTVGSNEVRAWPVPRQTTALDAAGKVHSDMKRGFIRAETFSFEEFEQFGDEKALKSAGKVRLEGKDYIVQDGDVIKFRFNV